MRMFNCLIIIATAFLCIFAVISDNAFGKSNYTIPNSLKSLSPEEKWVLTKVRKGEVADLVEKYDEPRHLRAEFIIALLTDGIKDLEIHFHGIQIENAIINHPLDLEFAEVMHNVGFFNCMFEDDVTFRNCHFYKSLWLNDSSFHGNADFHGLKVEIDLLANRSLFMFNETKSEHRSLSRGSFCNIRVGRNVSIKGAVFYCPVYFNGAEIGGQFLVYKTIFLNSEQGANFNGMKVHQEAIFRETKFFSLVDFIGTEIKGQLQIVKAYFLGKEKKHESDGSPKINDFHGMKVGKKAFFNDNIFNHEISLANCSFGDLIIKGEDFRQCMPILKLEEATVHGKLEICNVNIKELKAKRLNGKQQSEYANVEISNYADFRSSSFHQLTHKNNLWITDNNPLEMHKNSVKDKCKVNGMWLDGMSYQSIDIGEMPGCSEETKCTNLLNLIENSQFNFSNYTQLEGYFKRYGIEDQADRVYIAGKRSELWPNKWYEWINPIKWGTFLFWDLLTGYGRQPIRTLCPIILILIVGCFCFNPKYLDNKSWPKQFAVNYPIWTRIFLSFDRFVPIIDLGFEDYWTPKPWEVSKKTWIWWYFQFIFGWILIPIALAAIYTRIK